MIFSHKIKIYEADNPDFQDCVGCNDFDNNSCNIIIYLGEFNFRKNVNYKKLAKKLNDIFLTELICAISREKMVLTVNENYTICGHGGNEYICPIDYVIHNINRRWNKNEL
jgi:hypothetical protein